MLSAWIFEVYQNSECDLSKLLVSHWVNIMSRCDSIVSYRRLINVKYCLYMYIKYDS